jgi:acetyltransferase-like isoleucine patch superfamily enzyme
MPGHPERTRRPGCRTGPQRGFSVGLRRLRWTAEAAEPYDPGVEPVSSDPAQGFPGAAQSRRDRVRDGLAAIPQPPPITRRAPPPLHGGVLEFLRFARRRSMLRAGYAPLILRWAWLKLRWRGRLRTDGLCFVCPNVTFEIGKHATVTLGRWSWLGHGTKIRAHEGSIEIGAKTVLGQECTISAYQHVAIGRECIVADRVMLIDFDHGVVEVERPIREQGIYKRDVNVGHNVWIGYGACVLRGVTIGDNCVVGTSSVVTKDLPDDAVAAGAPARVVRQRAAPLTFRWGS